MARVLLLCCTLIVRMVGSLRYQLSKKSAHEQSDVIAILFNHPWRYEWRVRCVRACDAAAANGRVHWARRCGVLAAQAATGTGKAPPATAPAACNLSGALRSLSLIVDE